jgi:hypothetical protein
MNSSRRQSSADGGRSRRNSVGGLRGSPRSLRPGGDVTSTAREGPTFLMTPAQKDMPPKGENLTSRKLRGSSTTGK